MGWTTPRLEIEEPFLESGPEGGTHRYYLFAAVVADLDYRTASKQLLRHKHCRERFLIVAEGEDKNECTEILRRLVDLPYVDVVPERNKQTAGIPMKLRGELLHRMSTDAQLHSEPDKRRGKAGIVSVRAEGTMQ